MKHDAKYTPAAISRRALALATVTFALLLSANGCSWMFWHHAAGGPAAPVSRSAPKEKSGRKSGRAPAVAKHAQPESAPPDAHAQMAAHPQDPYWPYVIATECLARDSVAAAEAALRSALDRDAGYAPALSSLSKLLYQSGRHEEAITLLTQALAVADRYDDETRQILLAELALHQDALGRPDLARASVAEMPKPSLKQSRSALVYVTLRGEAPDSASAMAEKALDGDSRSPVNLNNFGITRLRAGDVDGALKAFNDAIERDPNLPGPYYNLAILEEFYRFDDVAASRWFHSYWKLSHSDPDSLLGLFHADGNGPAARQEN
jgi:tetratricopeptide (TPR) repeat protein